MGLFVGGLCCVECASGWWFVSVRLVASVVASGGSCECLSVGVLVGS